MNNEEKKEIISEMMAVLETLPRDALLKALGFTLGQQASQGAA